MTPREYTYVTYIAATAERVWSAITSNEFWLQRHFC